jgi:hypothetical protein
MDKIQAQRAVFQLRRKAINSVRTAPPINKPEYPNPASSPDWDGLAHDVTQRIRILQAATGDKLNAPPELRNALWNDIVVPNVRLLAEFCANVEIEPEETP